MYSYVSQGSRLNGYSSIWQKYVRFEGGEVSWMQVSIGALELNSSLDGDLAETGGAGARDRGCRDQNPDRGAGTFECDTSWTRFDKLGNKLRKLRVGSVQQLHHARSASKLQLCYRSSTKSL